MLNYIPVKSSGCFYALIDRFVCFFAVCGEISVTIYSAVVILFQLLS